MGKLSHKIVLDQLGFSEPTYEYSAQYGLLNCRVLKLSDEDSYKYVIANEDDYNNLFDIFCIHKIYWNLCKQLPEHVDWFLNKCKQENMHDYIKAFANNVSVSEK